ncbi:2'-5' RNA ligase family protein [Pokkaliibacter sp. CJK22405]|uniref:2'-5' RNA ligase family protein n=1 Tax=Pokkaliibacter sp. CJK22405 TaxID=3384615 RepID=UPI00398473E0
MPAVFYALSLTQVSQQALVQGRPSLPLQWHQPQDLHLTLAFIPDASCDELKVLDESLPLLTADVGDYLEIASLDRWQHPQGAEHWVARCAMAPWIESLYTRVRTLCEAQGVGTDSHHGFLPHVTLGWSHGPVSVNREVSAELSEVWLTKVTTVCFSGIGLYERDPDQRSGRYRARQWQPVKTNPADLVE